MKDIIRDSTLGQIINYVSRGRLLPYADQRPGYYVPARYRVGEVTQNDTLSGSQSPTLADAGGVDQNKEIDLEEAKKVDAAFDPTIPFVVTWNGPDDPDRPKNWSQRKRLFVAFLIALYTFSVYIGAAIYTSSIGDLQSAFNVSSTVATLGLSLFVLAYGIGPMILSPIQEMPVVGRNPVYIAGLFLFVVFQIPPIFAKNIETILIFRFLAGFVGSPALATGGASMGDIFDMDTLPFAIAAWSIGAVCGPVLGPVISGFAVQANGWRWSFYELLWISGFGLAMLFTLLPETLESTILLRRAQRLRKLTGNPQLKSQSEIDQPANQNPLRLAAHNFVHAVQLSTEPAILFANVYIGLVYAIFYLWFESFPLVFGEIYGFNLGLSGLPFVGFIVSAIFTLVGYVIYLKYFFLPRTNKFPNLPPEVRLELACVGSLFVPVSLFLFGWSSRESVHWIVPIIGAALYLPGVFLMFQSIIVYVTIGYYKHAASILAGNAFARSTLAAFFPLFGTHFFRQLGLGGGNSLLGGLSIIMIPIIYVLMKFGGRFRARSRWTDDDP